MSILIQKESNQKYREDITDKLEHRKHIENLCQLVKDVNNTCNRKYTNDFNIKMQINLSV